jgi:hypothetical protein
LIDHVYVPDAAAADGAGVVLDATLEVTGADGSPTTVNLSDHFGVRANITL